MKRKVIEVSNDYEAASLLTDELKGESILTFSQGEKSSMYREFVEALEKSGYDISDILDMELEIAMSEVGDELVNGVRNYYEGDEIKEPEFNQINITQEDLEKAGLDEHEIRDMNIKEFLSHFIEEDSAKAYDEAIGQIFGDDYDARRTSMNREELADLINYGGYLTFTLDKENPLESSISHNERALEIALTNDNTRQFYESHIENKPYLVDDLSERFFDELVELSHWDIYEDRDGDGIIYNTEYLDRGFAIDLYEGNNFYYMTIYEVLENNGLEQLDTLGGFYTTELSEKEVLEHAAEHEFIDKGDRVVIVSSSESPVHGIELSMDDIAYNIPRVRESEERLFEPEL